MKDIISLITKFRDDRDWTQFHNSKDLAIALNLESSELLELFLWKGNEDVNIERLKEELADVLMYALLMAEKHSLDIEEIIKAKLKLNDTKYPVDKAKGKSNKYNDL